MVWIPKYRKKELFEELRKELGPVLRELARHKESEILEGRILLDHVHMLMAIPPKYAVSQVVGYMKGKSAIHLVEFSYPIPDRRHEFVGLFNEWEVPAFFEDSQSRVR